MKVQELRELLKAADRDLLEKAFVESYKHLTKKQKEEADQAIADALSGKSVKSTVKKESVNFDELELQITEFLENAYAQNYFAPNRIIPKSQRPKWRFMVKNYIKELEKISVDDANYTRSAKLLTDLYHMLCEACNYYLFSTDDAFRSVGWQQPDLFQMVVKKTFGDGYSRGKISALLLYSVSGGLSRESLHIEQESVLLAELKTSDVKYMAIEEARKLIDERKQKLKGLKKYDSKRYSLEEEINNLCDVMLMTAIELAEPASGIEYYFQNYERSDKEITLYCALKIADWVDDEELWIKIYEYGIGKKIKPREWLVGKYESLK
ncbi:MAG: hypothetical protein K2O13_07715 [Lachnospiraceae bacterium]|nr:hypothetical protein [Lachnospiraceae bacterium]